MSNRIEEATIPAGARIRVGKPGDQPQEAIEALIALFSTKDNVVSAGLGLMEVIYPNGSSEFTYTIGIECLSDEAGAIRQAAGVLQNIPTDRWPISIVPANSQFFPKDVIPFFGKKAERSWVHRLLHFDLNSLWAKRETDHLREPRLASGTSAAPDSESKDLEEAIHRVVTSPSQESRQIFHNVLLRSHLLVGIQDLPEGVSSFPATLEEDTPCAMATSINPDGKEVLLAFSDRAAVRARDPALGFLEMSARSVLELVVQDNMDGVVINPAGRWLELGTDEIKTILAAAK